MCIRVTWVHYCSFLPAFLSHLSFTFFWHLLFFIHSIPTLSFKNHNLSLSRWGPPLILHFCPHGNSGCFAPLPLSALHVIKQCDIVQPSTSHLLILTLLQPDWVHLLVTKGLNHTTYYQNKRLCRDQKNSIWISKKFNKIGLDIKGWLPSSGSVLLQTKIPGQYSCLHAPEVAQNEFTQEPKVVVCFFSIFFLHPNFPSYQSQKIFPFKDGEKQTGPCEPWGPSCGMVWLCVPLGRALGYAVLLLEQGVLCVLPILWAALLFSEAGWDFWICCVPAVSPIDTEEGETLI